jgi:hypothetical protein
MHMKETVPKHAARFVQLTSERGKKAALAKHLGIENLSILNNWKFRGVPAEYAQAAAAFLGCAPEDICVNWMSAAPAGAETAHSKALSVEHGYIKLIMEECETASPAVLKTVLGILNGTIAPPNKPAELFAILDQQRFGALSARVEDFYAAQSDEEKTKIKLELGGQVIQMVDLRARDHGPPAGQPDLRSGRASK